MWNKWYGSCRHVLVSTRKKRASHSYDAIAFLKKDLLGVAKARNSKLEPMQHSRFFANAILRRCRVEKFIDLDQFAIDLIDLPS